MSKTLYVLVGTFIYTAGIYFLGLQPVILLASAYCGGLIAGVLYKKGP